MAQVSPFLIGVFVFVLVLGFWLVQSTAALPRFQKNTGLSVLALSIPLRSSRSCLATLSLDTVEDVVVGEVDELEEDVG